MGAVEKKNEREKKSFSKLAGPSFFTFLALSLSLSLSVLLRRSYASPAP